MVVVVVVAVAVAVIVAAAAARIEARSAGGGLIAGVPINPETRRVPRRGREGAAVVSVTIVKGLVAITLTTLVSPRIESNYPYSTGLARRRSPNALRRSRSHNKYKYQYKYKIK